MADKDTNVPNKNDFISREAAIETLSEFYHHKSEIQHIALREALNRVPSADVVEVVRCKDCINWNGNNCITIYGLYAPRPDDYCSRGEKNRG